MVFINYRCSVCGKILYHKNEFFSTFDFALNYINSRTQYQPDFRKGFYSQNKIHDCLCKSGQQLIKYDFCSVSEEQIPGSEEYVISN